MKVRTNLSNIQTMMGDSMEEILHKFCENLRENMSELLRGNDLIDVANLLIDKELKAV